MTTKEAENSTNTMEGVNAERSVRTVPRLPRVFLGIEESKRGRFAYRICLNKLQLESCESDNLHEQPAMFPTMNIRLSIEALFISNRNIQDFQVELTGPKQQEEIAERIEIPKVRSVCHLRS
jgi:hypothetical protein